MNSLFTYSVRLVAMLTAALTIVSGSVVAQDDLRPLIDSDSVQSVLQPNAQQASGADLAEDIPPPSPVPDAVIIPQPQPVTSSNMAPSVVGGESKAYEFGVSYVSTPQGIQVQGVIVDSRAASAGLRPNDMIIAVNGNPPSGNVLNQNVETVEVMRNGARQTLRVGAITTARPVMNSAVPMSAAPSAAYVPENRSAYSVPRAVYAAPRTYVAPRTTYSAPQSYRYAPSYNSRYAPSYRSSPRVSIGIGTGGFGPGIGYGRGGYGYGRGIGPGFGPSFGRYGGFGYGGGRSGISIGRGGFGRSGISIGFGF